MNANYRGCKVKKKYLKKFEHGILIKKLFGVHLYIRIYFIYLLFFRSANNQRTCLYSSAI